MVRKIIEAQKQTRALSNAAREEMFNNRLFMFSNRPASKRAKALMSVDTVSGLEPLNLHTYHQDMAFDFLFSIFRRASKTKAATLTKVEDENEAVDPNNPFPETVIIEFQDVIDLHSIPARQVRAVVEDYLEEARNQKTRWVRIIHGKGIGVQREIVRSILARTPHVVDFRDAPEDAGGWGATVVTLQID